MRRLKAYKILFLLLMFGFLISGGLALWINYDYTKTRSFSAPQTIIFKRGISARQIAIQLHRAGLIPQPSVLLLHLWLRGYHHSLKSGEYEFMPPLSIQEIIEKLYHHKVVEHRLTIIEGSTVAKVMQTLNNTFHWAPPLVTPPTEGTLHPETYTYYYGDTPAALLQHMQQAQVKILQAAWNDRPANFILKTPQDVLILASIVEKETAVARERPHIAAVFLNRLRKGMPLQADPTIAYALSKPSIQLTRADLNISSPYNTYINKGLPPGPICCPSQAAIEAVINPLDTEDLYFVADGHGAHIFSKHYDQHSIHHNALRKLRKAYK